MARAGTAAVAIAPVSHPAATPPQVVANIICHRPPALAGLLDTVLLHAADELGRRARSGEVATIPPFSAN